MAFRQCRAAVFAIAAAFAHALPAAGPAVAQNWVVYAPQGAGYSIELPGQPKVSVKNVPTDAGPAKMIQAVVEVGDAAYLASYIDFAQSIIASRGPEGHLDAARDGQVKGGRLVSETRIVVCGYPARYVVIAKGAYLVTTRSVFVGRRLFQMAYVGKPGTEDGPEAKRFHNSLKIIRQ